MTQTSGLILKTLKYADNFNYPLKPEEISRWLIATAVSKDNANETLRISFAGIKKDLALLVKSGQVGKLNSFYFLPGRGETINSRLTHQKYSADKYKIVWQAEKILSRFGWIRMIGVTGSLAMNNSRKEDDIDLLIITQTNRLWLTRPLVLLMLTMFGIKVRHYGEIKVADKICLNMFLDEDNLAMEERNLYVAHEIVQIKPVFDRGTYYHRLLMANPWVKDYLPFAARWVNLNKPLNQSLNRVCLRNILNTLNRFAYHLQYRYMAGRLTKEVVDLHRALFHPRKIGDVVE